MIVQNSIVCTKRMIPIQKFLNKHFNIYYSNFDDRPAKLFSGIHHMKGTILIGLPKIKITSAIFSTKFFRWYEDNRSNIFENLKYKELNSKLIHEGHVSKISDKIHAEILLKIYNQKNLGINLLSSGVIVYCHRIASYFIKSIDFIPYFYNETEGEKKSDDYKEYFVANEKNKRTLMSLFNSNIFYLNWHTLHDGYHCGKKNIVEFPFEFPFQNVKIEKYLVELGVMISEDYSKNSRRKETSYKNTGVVIYDEFYPKMSKSIIDEIDKVLAQHYGFTEEELDFIINYDIKYRMGKELEEGEEE